LGGDELPAWFGLLSVADVDEVIDKVGRLGGRVLEPAQKVADRGTMALVEDNQGAAFVLLDSGSRDPKFRPIRAGDWVWADLFVNDPAVANTFYQGLLGMNLVRITDDKEREIDLLVVNDTARAGLVEIPCVYRNATGAVHAMAAAEMALAGMDFPIPVDEVIDVMGEVGRKMDVRFRETALGGLATTPTGQKIAAAAGMDRLVQLQRRGRTDGESSARIGPS